MSMNTTGTSMNFASSVSLAQSPIIEESDEGKYSKVQEKSPKDRKGGLNEKALSVVNRVKEKLTGKAPG